ncbi:hypothetical protein KC19_4G108400 [Ceratodon purpureus]|uniref:Uncharacterized protein n=1 Tax=Ceratodon purpureus TaxID=3225 RepID=A0A8T0I9A2_CERPU|nr:hypothetical protein KC19_4G108400 [Ceratodon purpureus]
MVSVASDQGRGRHECVNLGGGGCVDAKDELNVGTVVDNQNCAHLCELVCARGAGVEVLGLGQWILRTRRKNLKLSRYGHGGMTRTQMFGMSRA